MQAALLHGAEIRDRQVIEVVADLGLAGEGAGKVLLDALVAGGDEE